MLADPEPYKLIAEFDSQCAVFQRHARRPDFLPVSLAELFKVKGRGVAGWLSAMRIACRSGADFGWQRLIIVPKIRVRAVHHKAALKELSFSGFVVGRSGMDAVVDAPRIKIALMLRVNGLRAVQIKSCVQFLQLARRQRAYCASNLLYCIRVHMASLLS